MAKKSKELKKFSGGSTPEIPTENSNKETEKKMSTEEKNTEKNAEKNAPKTEVINKTFKLYNLDTMKLEPIEIKDIQFTPAANFDEAIKRVAANAGDDMAEVTEILNNVLRNQVIAEEKKKKAPAGTAPKKVVLDFIKGYRQSPMFSKLVTKDKGDDGWKEEYDAQTDSILSQVKNVPFMMENLKAIAASAPDTETAGEEETA